MRDATERKQRVERNPSVLELSDEGGDGFLGVAVEHAYVFAKEEAIDEP